MSFEYLVMLVTVDSKLNRMIVVLSQMRLSYGCYLVETVDVLSNLYAIIMICFYRIPFFSFPDCSCTMDIQYFVIFCDFGFLLHS